MSNLNIYRNDNDLVISFDDRIVINNLKSHFDSLFMSYDESNGSLLLAPVMSNLNIVCGYLMNNGIEFETTDAIKAAIGITKKREDVNSEYGVVVRKTNKAITQQPVTPATEVKIDSSTLTDVLKRVRHAVSQSFSSGIWVEAEISSLKSAKNGHAYIDLIETDSLGNEVAKARAISWNTDAKRIMAKFKKHTGSDLAEGQKVLFFVEVNYDIRYGLSLKITDVNPEFTLGSMQQKINTIRKQLIDEKIYDSNKSIDIPFQLKRVAVISPDGAAGLMDFFVEVNKLEKAGVCSFDYYSAVFQGANTTKSIVSAIERMIENHNNIEGYDVAIIIRGGGAKTDLHFLNEYDIAKAVCLSPVPFVVGIGHQIDHGILDEVANMTHDTPSKVAHWVLSDVYHKYEVVVEEFKSFVDLSEQLLLSISNHCNLMARDSGARLVGVVDIYNSNLMRIFNHNSSIVSNLANNLSRVVGDMYVNNMHVINGGITIVENAIHRDFEGSNYNINNLYNHCHQYINNMYSNIEHLNPINVFKRGFSVAMSNDKPIVSSNDISSGDPLTIYLADGIISTKVI